MKETNSSKIISRRVIQLKSSILKAEQQLLHKGKMKRLNNNLSDMLENITNLFNNRFVSYKVGNELTIIKENRKKMVPQRCKGLKPLNLSPRDGLFQTFPEKNMSLYSAYLDLRLRPPLVKVIGFSPVNPGLFYCQFYYKDGVVVSSPGFADHLGRGRTRPKFRYKPHIYFCIEPRGVTPYAVSLTPEPCLNKITNLVKIHQRKKIHEKRVSSDILVCVKTLYNYSSSDNLIEFLEFQKLFGASHVKFYDFDNITEDVIKVIKYYKNTGFVSSQPWPLKIKTHRNYQKGVKIRTYGQEAQINDCVYRFMNKYKYIIIIDTDEFIIPRNKTIRSYKELIKQLLKNKKKVASLQFPHAHFCKSEKSVKSSRKQFYDIQLSRIFKRSVPSGYDSHTTKCIINPRRVEVMYMHWVMRELYPFTKVQQVPPYVGMLHHYHHHRKVKECNVIDKTTMNYVNELKQGITQIHNEINL